MTPASPPEPRFAPVADHGLLIEFATVISDDTSQRVQALDRALRAVPPVGVIEVVPAFVNLLVDFDPLLTDHRAIEASVRALLPELDDERPTPSLHEVAVCYDDDFGPDLSAVADACSMSVEAVIGEHLAGDYRVSMYGFAPGYAYMAGVGEPIRVPRKSAPVRDVAARSVIIAGPQCLITTMTMPTGWSIIGRSALDVLTGDDDDPFRFDVGDRIVFSRVDRAAFDRIDGENGLHAS